jgi:hypothetical protein
MSWLELSAQMVFYITSSGIFFNSFTLSFGVMVMLKKSSGKFFIHSRVLLIYVYLLQQGKFLRRFKLNLSATEQLWIFNSS